MAVVAALQVLAQVGAPAEDLAADGAHGAALVHLAVEAQRVRVPEHGAALAAPVRPVRRVCNTQTRRATPSESPTVRGALA